MKKLKLFNEFFWHPLDVKEKDEFIESIFDEIKNDFDSSKLHSTGSEYWYNSSQGELKIWRAVGSAGNRTSSPYGTGPNIVEFNGVDITNDVSEDLITKIYKLLYNKYDIKNK